MPTPWPGRRGKPGHGPRGQTGHQNAGLELPRVRAVWKVLENLPWGRLVGPAGFTSAVGERTLQ